MNQEEVKHMLMNLDIDNDLFSDDEKAIIEKGGLSVSESDKINDNITDDEYDRRIIEAIGSDAAVFGSAPGIGLAMPDGERGVLEERYKFENNYLQLQTANLKAEYYKRVGDLERAIERLRREKKEAEASNLNQRKEYEIRLLQQKEVAKEEVLRAREEGGQLGQDAPLLRDKISTYKSGLKNLLVSEDKYLELRSIPEPKRNIKEYVQVKAYELVKKYKDQNESLRRQNEDLSDTNLKLSDENKKLIRETNYISNLLNNRENDYTNRIEDLEIRNKELQEAIHKLRINEDRFKEKEREYDSIKQRLRETEKTNSSLQAHVEIQSETVLKANNKREDYEKQYDNLQRQIDLLNQDKTFLERDNSSLLDRIRRLETDIDRLEDQKEKQYTEMMEAKKNAQNYLERLLNNTSGFGTDAHKKHLAELEAVKTAHEKQLQMHRENLSDVYEKKIEYLKETKEESEMKLAKAERDLLEKTTAYDEILVEFRKLQTRTDEAVGGVSHELRYKSDELVRVTHLYEDNLALVKELKLENAQLKEKADLIKQEYYRVEANERQKNADALAQVAVYKERLAHYEAIEKELDDAIINVAENNDQSEVGDIVLNAVKAAPTASNRRVQQSLLLANRLQAKQKEVERLKKEIKDLKTKMNNMTDDSKMYRRLADKANQPYSYLMADIEKGEKDLNSAFKRLRTKEDEINSLREENKALKIAVNKLQDDLSKLLNKRKQLDNLQSTLMSIVKGSSTKKISVDYLRNKLAESKRENKFKDQSDGLSFMKLTGLGKTTDMSKNNQKSGFSKSRSPQKHPKNKFDDDERTTMRKSDVDTPAWYTALKSNLRQ